MIAYFFRTFRMALHALRRNIFRSFLTTLGIVIGVAAVIAMTEIGQGTSNSVQRTIQSMGANNLLVQPGTATSSGVSLGLGSVVTLTAEDAEAIKRDCPGAEHVAPIVRARTQIIYASRNWVPLYIYGTTPEFLKVREWETLEEGESFSERDILNQVCMLGQTIVRELFPNESPIGKEIRINNVPFRVIGVLTRKGASMQGLDQDDIVVAPWRTIRNRVSANSLVSVNQSQPVSTDPSQKPMLPSSIYPRTQQSIYPMPSQTQLLDNPQPVRFSNVDWIMVKSRDREDLEDAKEQIRELLRERHHIGKNIPDDFTIRDMTELSKSLASTSEMMMRTLFFVALISLVVGGVGIMNIMMVSVTERTREIGLRMAVGARARDILFQFLVEAVALCITGGIVGIALGRGAASLVSWLLNWPVEMSLPAILAAVGVSVVVGISFGYYPAWKASRLDPIEALRYE